MLQPPATVKNGPTLGSVTGREEGVEFVPRPSEWREDWVAKKQGGG